MRSMFSGDFVTDRSRIAARTVLNAVLATFVIDFVISLHFFQFLLALAFTKMGHEEIEDTCCEEDEKDNFHFRHPVEAWRQGPEPHRSNAQLDGIQSYALKLHCNAGIWVSNCQVQFVWR